MSTQKFDIALTKRISKYKDAVWYQGGTVQKRYAIRWMLEDETGTSVYCDQCGNLSNGVLIEPVERYALKIPLCRTHLELWMKEYPDFIWNETCLVLYKPDMATVTKNWIKEIYLKIQEKQHGDRYATTA